MSIIIGMLLTTTALAATSGAFWLVCANTTLRTCRVVVSHDKSCGIFLLLGLSTTVNATSLVMLVAYFLGRVV